MDFLNNPSYKLRIQIRLDKWPFWRDVKKDTFEIVCGRLPLFRTIVTMRGTSTQTMAT